MWENVGVIYVTGGGAHCNQWVLNIHDSMARKREKGDRLSQACAEF